MFLIVVLITFRVPCCDVCYDFRIKTRCSVRLYLQFVGVGMFLFTLFVFACAWWYLKLPVSLYCAFLIAPSVFSNIYLSCVLCTLCCQFLCIVLFWLPLRYSLIFICPVSCWQFLCIVLFWLPLRYSLIFICPVSCVPYVASFSGLSFYITPSVFSNMYLSCVLCILCCQFLWIVLFHCPFGIL